MKKMLALLSVFVLLFARVPSYAAESGELSALKSELAGNAGTITLTEVYTVPSGETITVPENKTLIFEGGGFTFEAGSKYVTNGKTVIGTASDDTAVLQLTEGSIRVGRVPFGEDIVWFYLTGKAIANSDISEANGIEYLVIDAAPPDGTGTASAVYINKAVSVESKTELRGVLEISADGALDYTGTLRGGGTLSLKEGAEIAAEFCKFYDGEHYFSLTEKGTTVAAVSSFFSDDKLPAGEFSFDESLDAYVLSGMPDVPNIDSADAWAKDGIISAVNKGFVPADLQNNYKNVITRQEFCRMAVKWLEYASGQSVDDTLADKSLTREINAFSDTQDADILAAYALGITSGMVVPTPDAPGIFDPNGQFSRQQAATMLRSVCLAYGSDVSDCPDAGWTDIGSVASWAVDSVNFCYKNGFMDGTSTTELVFGPEGPFTREMSIVTLNNINPATLPKAN